MDRASWAEPVRVGFETGFPFGFEGQPDERLCGSRADSWNAKRSLLGLAGFWDPHPTHRLRLVRAGERSHQCETLGWREGFEPSHMRGLLAPIGLRHTAHGP